MKSLSGKAQGRLGRYELLARLATGGMGEIFLGRLEGAAGFEKLYVIKRVLPHLADDARFRAMLIEEARIAAKMSHPNICQVYELGEDQNQLFIAMEYLEGVTLLPVLRRASRSKQPLSVGLVAAVLQQTCDALHYAHELNERDGTRLHVVHRDVTPSNLFLTENGTVKVLDFGIAKAKDASAHTQDGTVKGKYAYMAPEQLRSEDADRRVDIFALAVVGFEMLALRRLFQRKTDYLTFRAVMELPIPDLREFRPDLPRAVGEVFSRALERDPKNRFATARQFTTAMQDAISGIAKSWTTSEIGDYLRQNFAEELRKRGSALSTAIQHGETSTATGRMTMPMLEAIDAQPEDAEHDEQDDFPSIDTGVHSLEDLSRREPAPGDGTYALGGGSTLTELSAAPGIALQRRSEAIVIQAPSRRALLWPIFAVAIVGAGATALWFMWQQIKSQSKEVVIVTPVGDDNSGSSAQPVVTPDASTVVVAFVPGAPDAAVAIQPPPDDVQRDKVIRAPDDIFEHIKKRLSAVGRSGAFNRCVEKFGAGVAEKPRSLKVVVGKDGKAKATVEPEAVRKSPLGGCIERAVESTAFSRIATETTVNVPFNPK